MDFGFPTITDSFLLGQDILYTQFNDINYYVEDIDQENFYYAILKKLFPDVAFEKIFPLGGKQNTLDEASLYVDDRKKVYIVDLDFDDILDNISPLPNVFYLGRYSIENYLLEYDAIKEIIKEEKPKLKNQYISELFKLEDFLQEAKSLFSELIKYYLIIQKNSLGVINVDNDTARFCDFTKNPAEIKSHALNQYHIIVKTKLLEIKPRMKIERQLLINKKYTTSINKTLKHVPGKYLLNFLKYRIEHLFSYPQMSLDSFTYRLSRNCSLSNLQFLKVNINNFVNNNL